MPARRRGRGSSTDATADAHSLSGKATPHRLVVGQGLPDTELLGRLMRRIRTDRKLSAREVAQRVGVSDSYVRAIERGSRAPSPAVAMDIFDALDVHPEQASGADEAAEFAITYNGDVTVIEMKRWTGNTELSRSPGHQVIRYLPSGGGKTSAFLQQLLEQERQVTDLRNAQIGRFIPDLYKLTPYALRILAELVEIAGHAADEAKAEHVFELVEERVIRDISGD